MKPQLIKNLLRWGLRIVIAVVVLFALFLLEEHVRGRILLARYKTELRAKGEKLTLAELDLPNPPMNTNAVAALLEAVDELVALTRAGGQYPPYLPTMLRIAPGRVMVLRQQDWLGPPGRTNITWDKLSADVATVSDALDKAKRAANQPDLALTLDYKKDLGEQLQHLGKMHRLSSWLAAATLDALRKDNLDGALENIIAMTDLTRALKYERVVGVQRTRLSMAAEGLRVTWQALQADGWTEPQLENLQRTWQEAECLPDLVPSMEMERVTSLQYSDRDVLNYLRDGRKFVSYWREDMQHGWDYQQEMLMIAARWWTWRVVWLAQDRLRMLRRWQETIDCARAVARQKAWTACPVKREQRWMFYDRWRYLMSGLFYIYESDVGRAARYETLREMTVTAIALKRYQLRNAKFPADLSAFVPEFLPDLPLDWMNGKPLRYRLNADGTFTLYSVGENGVDDGGEPDSPPISWWLDCWGNGDEVWPLPATDEQVEERYSRLVSQRRTGRSSER
jgi:hypothetical protein